MTFRLMISHVQVRFLGLRLAAGNTLFDVFHILTSSNAAFEKSHLLWLHILYLVIKPLSAAGISEDNAQD